MYFIFIYNLNDVVNGKSFNGKYFVFFFVESLKYVFYFIIIENEYCYMLVLNC